MAKTERGKRSDVNTKPFRKAGVGAGPGSLEASRAAIESVGGGIFFTSYLVEVLVLQLPHCRLEDRRPSAPRVDRQPAAAARECVGEEVRRRRAVHYRAALVPSLAPTPSLVTDVGRDSHHLARELEFFELSTLA